MSELEPCYRHPDRRTALHCTRCGNPTCPDCIIPAPVGHHCPACVAAAGQETRKVRRISRAQPGVGAVVLVLLAANVVVQVLVQQDPSLLYRLANERSAFAGGEYYRLLTSVFVHVGWLHLGLNCLSLAYVGTLVEAGVGRAKFLALYLLSGLGGSVATLLVGPPSSAGASGAVFGVTGAAVIMLRRRRMDVRPLAGLVVLDLLMPFVIPRINWVAHVGGLAIGIAVAAGFDWAESGPRPRRREAGVVAAAAMALLAMVPVGVRWTPEQEADTILAVMEQQRRVFLRLGQTAEEFGSQLPLALPVFQAVRNGVAHYDVYLYPHPARPRTVRIQYGDGTTDEATVPAGSSGRKVRFEHRFAKAEARYQQRLTIAEVDDFIATFTDVCPNGTIEVPEPTGDIPMCARF